MPKCTYTPDLLVGYILGKMERLRKIVYYLENQESYTMMELEHVRVELLETDAEVQLQAKMVKDERVGPKMIEFRALLRRAIVSRERREQRARAIEQGTNEQPIPPIQFDDVGPPMGTRASPTGEELEIYASDNEDEFPLELRSTVRPAQTFEPIRIEPMEPIDSTNEPQPSTSRQADLRDQLEHQRTAASYGVQHGDRENSRNAGAQRGRGRERHFETSRIFVPSRTSDRSRSDHRGRPGTVSSVSSYGSAVSSYVSGPQERFDAPVTDRAYPPVLRAPPTPLARNDKSLIGRSEIYTHPPQGSPRICPICPLGQHRLYRCTTFLRMGLQEKWYTVLKKGLCVNCLIRGHSHFACDTPGACYRCGRRHNSKLCPEGPNNQQTDE